MDELEKIIEKAMYPFHTQRANEVAKAIRESGFHRHEKESEYCSCEFPEEDFSDDVHPNHCKHCGKPLMIPPSPTPMNGRREMETSIINSLEYRIVIKALRILHTKAMLEQMLKDFRICSPRMREIEELQKWFLKK